ncbi:MAG: hypothetical protein U1F41_15635 [Burkholderiales bacterium]
MLCGTPAAQPFTAKGHCRDGQPHGVYELRDEKGTVRAVGAYNRGKRTGSFIFWSSGGVRIAHLPFEEDELSGTLAIWHAGRPGREPQRKLEASYRNGRLEGDKRSWYANGSARAEYRYENGVLRTASASTEAGKPLSEADARALAQRDEAIDHAFVMSLLAIVRDHPPRCDAAGDKA